MPVCVSGHFIVLFIFIFTGTGVASYAFISLILVVHTSLFHFMCLFFKVEVPVQLELCRWGWYYCLSHQPAFPQKVNRKLPCAFATVP